MMEKYNTIESNIQYQFGSIFQAEIKSKIPNLSNALVIAWFLDSIKCYKVIDGKISQTENFDADLNLLVRLRVFNQDHETYIWKDANSYKYRVIDESIQPSNANATFIETVHPLWGKVTSASPKGSIVADQGRGIELLLPNEYAVGKEVSLKIRNYYKFDEVTLNTYYFDQRFVSLI